jgi:hypothetical protein
MPNANKANAGGMSNGPASIPDPFDLAAIRLDPNAAEAAGVEKLLLTVPVRKPHKQDYFRVHPGEAFRMAAAVIEIRETNENETYLLNAEMSRALPGEYAPVTLYTVMNRQGILSIWPVKLPSADGRHNTWQSSAAEAAELAMGRWIRVVPNMALGANEIFAATGSLQDPVWPCMAFEEILKIAFRDRFVTDLSHPLVKRLHGAE